MHAGNVLRFDDQWLRCQLLERVLPPRTRLAHIQQAFHALDRDLPVDDYAEIVGAASQCVAYRRGKQRFGHPSMERDTCIEQIAVHRSPARKRSSSTGSSHPGRSLIRSFIPPNRTARDSGGGASWATGLPSSVMTTLSPFSMARISSGKRLPASAIATFTALPGYLRPVPYAKSFRPAQARAIRGAP